MITILNHIKNNVFALFSKKNILLQVLACFLTYLIVISGFDWNYFVFVQTYSLNIYLFPAVIIGGLVPIFGIPIVYILSKILHKKDISIVAYALAEAVAFGWLISSFYKAFTGRIQPPHGLIAVLHDTSRDWNFGFLKHGIFWGWPSSHTTVAFAMSSLLITLYPKQKTVFYCASFYALYIGLGVSTQIHWFSEFVAGAIIGTVVGTIVGGEFYTTLHKNIK